MQTRSARVALVAALAALLGSTQGTPPARAQDAASLAIAGSDSMAPLLETIAGTAPPLGVAVEGRGSQTGAVALLRGEADVASMTRPLSALEKAAFQARYGAPPLEVPIGVDAVALVVNAANPLERIEHEQVAAIFAADPGCAKGARIERWGELGPPVRDGEFADRRIGIYAPPPESGTRALFRQLALCGSGVVSQARRQPGTRSVAAAVAESRFGIGITTMANRSPALRALALPAAGGTGFSLPTPEEVRDRRYPFAHALSLVVRPGADGALDARVRALLDRVLSDAGQQEVDRAGFVALSREELAAARALLAP